MDCSTNLDGTVSDRNATINQRDLGCFVLHSYVLYSVKKEKQTQVFRHTETSEKTSFLFCNFTQSTSLESDFPIN